jgi:hypothetical protein
LGRPATAIPSVLERSAPRRAAAVLVLIVLLIAALAGALSGTARGTSALQGGPASVALSIALTLLGVVVVILFAVLLYAFALRPRLSTEAGDTPRRSIRRRIVGVCFLVGAIGLLALFGHLHPHRLVSSHAVTPSPVRAVKAGHSPVHFVPMASLSTLGAIAVVVALLVLASWWRARRRGRRWDLGELLLGREEGRSPTGTAGTLAESLAEVHVSDPDEEPDPRRAVVAAYVAMNHAAARAGAARGTHETASEFLQRLLGSLGASHDAARRLTSLFESARYSTAPFEETLRLDAINALRRVQAELTPLDMVGSK